jgi:hypothetical protein
VIAERLVAQLLCGPPAATPEEVVRHLLAVQAQDPRGARLSIRSRSAGLSAADVDAALERRSLVVSWLNRGTLHLVAAEDYWWLHPLTTPQMATGNRRRLQQEGVSPQQAARGVEVIDEAVLAHGPQTRAQLRARLAAAGVPTDGQALVHLLAAATIAGGIVRGPMRGADQAFVAVSEWLGPAPPPLGTAAALGRLAARYLAGHGPAGPVDLAKWAGVSLGQARLWLESIDDELISYPGGLVDVPRTATPQEEKCAPLPPPRLLGAFDPLLLGWASREAFVGNHHSVVTTNGLFRPFALVGGRVVATWGLSAGELTIRLLEPVAASDVDALVDDANAVLRFLSVPPTTAVSVVGG